MPASKLPPGDPATAPTLPEPAPLPELGNGPLRNALDCSDNAIAITNSDRQVVYVNHGFTRLFGFSMQDIRGKYLSHLLQGPHTHQGLTEAIRTGLRLHGHYHGDALIYSRDGQPRWVSMVVNAADEAVGGPGGSITVLTDITLTKMHEVLQKRVLESMVSETSLPALMAQVCKEVESIAPEVTASILAVDAHGRIHPLAAPGLPPDICAALDGLQIGPSAGSCGTAAYWGTPVVTTDIATDPRWDNYRALFLPTGLQACWSSPIRDHLGMVIGTFASTSRSRVSPMRCTRAWCRCACTCVLWPLSAMQRASASTSWRFLTRSPDCPTAPCSAAMPSGPCLRWSETTKVALCSLWTWTGSSR